jgi:hypothetical protein
MSVELRFPAPNRPLSINEANSMRHWAAKKRRLDPWKEATQWAWKGAASYQWIVKGKPTLVEIELPFKEVRRRDPHNYTGTIMKTVVDALVTKKKAGEVIWDGAWPDDTPEWVETAEPIIVQGGTEVVIRLTPRPASA